VWTTFLERLRRRRALEDARLTALGLGHTFSLQTYSLHRSTSEALARFAQSPILDAGSGRSPYKPFLSERGIEVVSVDLEDRGGGVDLIADIEDLAELRDGSMRTILCTQVLEHVPHPWRALSELARVLEPGGILILTVPHLSAIHEAPNDFFRFTRFGLSKLLADVGLREVETRESGGLLTLLGHGVSMVLMCSLGAIPLLRWPIWVLNYAMLVRAAELLDRVFGMRRTYPCNYVAVAAKPLASESRP